MKKLKLFALYLKKFKFSKYIVVLQYLSLFFILVAMIPRFRAGIMTLNLVNKYPFNKMVYYNNISPLETQGTQGQNINGNTIIENNNIIYKLIENNKNISSISSFVSLVDFTPINSGRKNSAKIYDKNSFSALTNKKFQNDEKLYVIVNNSKKNTDKFKIGQTYDFILGHEGKEYTVKAEILDYLDNEIHTVPSYSTVGVRDFSFKNLIETYVFSENETRFFLLENEELKKL